jgi:hypothetical protein
MANLIKKTVKKTSKLLEDLKKIEDKQIALRAAIKRRDTRLAASQNHKIS